MIDYALRKARELPYRKGRQRHFCVITDKRGRILAASANSYIKSSPKMKRAGQAVGLDEKIFWHAECKALYSVINPGKIHKLTVVRIDSEGNAVNSKPCIICETVAKTLGVKVIEYSV